MAADIAVLFWKAHFKTRIIPIVLTLKHMSISKKVNSKTVLTET